MTHPEVYRQKLRILVVDDEASIREVVSAALREEGHFVETAVDGLDGLEHFRRGVWDVVLTDRAMPGLTGDQLAAEIKIVAPHLPVIMVSGFAPTISDAHDQPSAVDLLVRKPFRLDALKQAIQRALQMYSEGATGSHDTGDGGENRAVG